MPLWWNWYTRQVEGLCLLRRAGSSPVGGILRIFEGLISPFFVPIPSAYRFGMFGLLHFQPSPQKQDHNYDLFL